MSKELNLSGKNRWNSMIRSKHRRQLKALHAKQGREAKPQETVRKKTGTGKFVKKIVGKKVDSPKPIEKEVKPSSPFDKPGHAQKTVRWKARQLKKSAHNDTSSVVKYQVDYYKSGNPKMMVTEEPHLHNTQIHFSPPHTPESTGTGSSSSEAASKLHSIVSHNSVRIDSYMRSFSQSCSSNLLFEKSASFQQHS